MARHRIWAAGLGLLLSASLAMLSAPASAEDQWYRNLQAKAAAGDTASQLEFGNMLLGEYWSHGDVRPGLTWITKAADAGDAAAQLRLGSLYDTGTVVKADPDQAMVWYRKASDNGNGEASLALAQHYDIGSTVQKDLTQAVKLYELAAGQGSAPAAFELGRRYDGGIDGAPLDRVKSMHWFEVAGPDYATDTARLVCVDNSDPSGSDDDWARALPYCRDLDAQADPTGIYGMGMAYAYGKGVVQDSNLAVDYLTRAATAGRFRAMAALGDIYLAGKIVPQDAVLALDWHRKAIRAGSHAARLALALQYERGQGTPVDLAAAARLYEIIGRSSDAEEADVAGTWFASHPQFSTEQIRKNIISVANIPRNVILYDSPKAWLKTAPIDLADYMWKVSRDLYPRLANENEVEGAAFMECRVSAAGEFVDCVLLRETPSGYGFGRALGQIVDKLNLSRNKADWVGQFAGKTVSINVGFSRW